MKHDEIRVEDRHPRKRETDLKRSRREQPKRRNTTAVCRSETDEKTELSWPFKPARIKFLLLDYLERNERKCGVVWALAFRGTFRSRFVNLTARLLTRINGRAYLCPVHFNNTYKNNKTGRPLSGPDRSIYW